MNFSPTMDRLCNQACYDGFKIIEEENATAIGGFFLCTDNDLCKVTGLTTPFVRAAKYRLRDAGIIEWKVKPGENGNGKKCKNLTYIRIIARNIDPTILND